MGAAHCGILKSASGAELVGVFDISEEARKKAADQYEVRAYESESDLLAEVDGVVVATPGFYHTEPVVAAAQAGVHVMVEKPLGSTLEECDKMIAACDENKVILMVGQVLRFYPCHELGMKIVRDGGIGEMVYVETDYSGPYNAPRQRPESWFGQMGGLLENGIHKVDLINYYGGNPVSVSAETGSFSGHDDWEDYVVSLIRYDTGIVGIFRWGGFMGARGSRDTFLDGTKGSLNLIIQGSQVKQKMIGESDWTVLKPDNADSNTVLNEDQHFIDCIRDGKTPIIDGRGGRSAVELTLAIYRSAEKREKVILPM